MRHIKLSTCLVFGCALLLVACGQAPTTGTAPATVASAAASTSAATSSAATASTAAENDGDESAAANDPAARLVTLDLMRGHVISSLENARAREYALALQHAQHPFAENYDQIKAQVQQSNAAFDNDLRAAFQTYQDQIKAQADAATLEQSRAAIDGVLNKIEQALVPNAPALSGRAVATVLTTAAEEYGASIDGGKFIAPIEYQDAYGFVRSAGARYDRDKGTLNAESASTQAALATMTTALPTIAPPSSVIRTATDVEAAVAEVGKQFGVISSSSSDSESLQRTLTDMATMKLGDVEAAVDKNDVAAARAAWETFNTAWAANEDGVRSASKDSYRAIEQAIGEVEDAIVRADKLDPARAKAATAAIRSEIEKFASTLK